jgi:hypothetical protein
MGDNIKTNLQEIWENLDWFLLAQMRHVAGCCEEGKIKLRVLKRRGFLD